LACRRVTVITANLAAFDVLREAENVELVLLGGLVRRPYHSLVGVLTEDALRQVRPDIAFLSTSGVRPDGQILDTTLVEVPIKRAIVAAAKRTALLADRHKFPGTGVLRVCGAADIDIIVTNKGADDSTLRTCAAAGVEVLTG
jgi:DeoR/GlpR family transcriptional regulator of sugar metabolism